MKKVAGLLLLSCGFFVQAQTIVSWTEENGTLGLGYPVPIPVNTMDAFDGFRSYEGLFAKHQSMALNNPNITGHIVGQTHFNRDIWSYVLSDENNLTKYGVKEGAMLINGNIHAREWQSPEVLTGIIELLDENSQDLSLHQFLLENTTIVALPVNNVDGLLQTQRFPDQNWLNVLGDNRPRDGRMRRKNMLNVDENLSTQNDYLLGVDLNRNNNPFWATSNSSSPIMSELTYHGASAQSEPETRARLNAANLVDADQVRIYTDVHSFTMAHLSVQTNNQSRNILQARLLLDFTQHHRAFPASKNYVNDSSSGPGSGIGSTDEFFATVYEVPSWTLEIEPTFFGGGTDYGGFGRNIHDGFILPEAEITRVREQLAQSFMVVWYGQAGPPSITELKIVEKQTGAVVYDSGWDIQDNGVRQLLVDEIDSILPGEEYSLIVSFDKPMRIRDENGQTVHLQGQVTNPNVFPLNPNITANISGDFLDLDLSNGHWLNQKTADVFSYKYYKDDTYSVDFSIPVDVTIDEESRLSWSIDVADMILQKLDADPATVVTWADGQWQNYENSNGQLSISGGRDSSYSMPVAASSDHAFNPFIQPTGLYFDPLRNGEGFSYELLQNNLVWLQWFSYDDQGNQRWYSGLGEYHGNTIIVNNLSQASGGIFGAEFDPENITFETFGSVKIVFSGGEVIEPAIGVHQIARSAQVLFTDINGKKLRTDLQQISFVKGAINNLDFIFPTVVIEEPVGLITGSWYDPQRSGEGYIIEILEDERAILIWYSYDLTGQHMWLIDSTGIISTDGNDITLDFDNVQVTNGGIFGESFNPDEVNTLPWGTLHFELNCHGSGIVSYSSTIEGFGSGQYNISKLTNPLLRNFVCDVE